MTSIIALFLLLQGMKLDVTDSKNVEEVVKAGNWKEHRNNYEVRQLGRVG